MDIPVITRWYNNLLKPSQPDPKTAQELAGKVGVNLADDQATPIPLGTDISASEITFFKYWLNTFKSYDEARANRYKTYEIMDTNSTEVSLMLDTYAAEALSIGFVEHPLSIRFSDKNAEAAIMSILQRCDFFNESMSNIRSLAKYGDLFYQILIDDQTKEVNIRKMTPNQVEIVEIKGLKGILGFKINQFSRNNEDQRQYKLGSQIIKDHVLKPWDLVQFSIQSDEFYPYGKAEIERIRSAYDQLITMEALFAISRANRVERLVIKVPTNQTNPTSAFAKLQQLKAQIKSVVLGQGSQGRFTANKEWGLTDILFMPAGEDFEIDKLASNIDISSDEDVRYFLEKMINGSRLPKGFLSGDEVTDRGNMLAQQDLRFARALIPIQQAYVAGVVKLCTVLGVLLGFKDLQVEASIEKPSQITQEQITRYSEQINAASNFIRMYMDLVVPDNLQPVDAPGPEASSPSESALIAKAMMEAPGGMDDPPPMMVVPKKIPPDLFVQVMMKFGVPKSIATCMLGIDNSAGPDSKISSADSVAALTDSEIEAARFITASTPHTNDVRYIRENAPKYSSRKTRQISKTKTDVSLG